MVVTEGWDRGLIPKLKIWAQLAGVYTLLAVHLWSCTVMVLLHSPGNQNEAEALAGTGQTIPGSPVWKTICLLFKQWLN